MLNLERKKDANNVRNKYCLCNLLYDFIQLLLINTTKEPTRLLTNNFVPIKKKRICLNCKRYLNLQTSGHRVSNKNFPVHRKNWRFTTWDFLKNDLFQIYGNIDELFTLQNLSTKIKLTDKDWLKRYMNDLSIFYSVENDH